MSTRRGFLKAAFATVVTASVSSVVLEAAIDFIVTEHPDVKAVLDRMIDLEPHEKKAIANFVLAEIENGNWAKMDSFMHFGLGEGNALIDWKS